MVNLGFLSSLRKGGGKLIKSKQMKVLQVSFLTVNSCRYWDGIILEDKLEIYFLENFKKRVNMLSYSRVNLLYYNIDM